MGLDGRDISPPAGRLTHPDAPALIRELTIGQESRAPDEVNARTEASVMQWVAVLAGEPWSYRPECACPYIRGWVQSINAAIDDWSFSEARALRTRLLKPLIPALIRSRRTVMVEERRSFVGLDFLIRDAAPMSLRALGLCARAQTLADIPPIVDRSTARQAHPAVRRAFFESGQLGALLPGDRLEPGIRTPMSDPSLALRAIENYIAFIDRDFIPGGALGYGWSMDLVLTHLASSLLATEGESGGWGSMKPP